MAAITRKVWPITLRTFIRLRPRGGQPAVFATLRSLTPTAGHSRGPGRPARSEPQTKELFRSMKVWRRRRQPRRGQVTPLRGSTMNGTGVDAPGRRRPWRQPSGRHQRAPSPARPVYRRGKNQREAPSHVLSDALEPKHKMVSVWAQLDLDVDGRVRSSDEHLDHLVVPELPRRPRGSQGRGVVVEWGVDVDDQSIALDDQRNRGDFCRPGGAAVP